uniref:Endothelial zinc finger protein induced by tumor necrosis factor alpha n=1 Tax=Phallusia mammillata TaxID=59560 RepID=A0A6F9DX78_9ASCI|nr:endothelial zinc finger protein induced by tumor necrosis factor alpha [Phallusia mammillata]
MMNEESLTEISNSELFGEIKRLRVDMKEMYWQMLLKFNEQFMGIQNQLKILNQNLVVLNSSKTLLVNSNPEDVYFGKDISEHPIDNSPTGWSLTNNNSTQENLQAMSKDLDSEDAMYDDNEDDGQIAEQTPVVLEVTTSHTGALNEMLKDNNDQHDKSVKEGLENVETVSPYTCLSRHMYEESSHIANCKDRHCMLCRSLCVSEHDNFKLGQKSQWKCAICLKYFRRKYNLKNHMRCHTGEKPYQCKTCKRFFRSKQALNYHAHKHDGNYQQKLHNKVQNGVSQSQKFLV